MSFGSETLKLNHPFTRDDVKYKSLTMQAPTVAQQIDASKAKGTPVEKELTLFASLCGVDDAVLLMMHADDWERLQEMYLGFLPSKKKILEKQLSSWLMEQDGGLET